MHVNISNSWSLFTVACTVRSLFKLLALSIKLHPAPFVLQTWKKRSSCVLGSKQGQIVCSAEQKILTPTSDTGERDPRDGRPRPHPEWPLGSGSNTLLMSQMTTDSRSDLWLVFRWHLRLHLHAFPQCSECFCSICMYCSCSSAWFLGCLYFIAEKLLFRSLHDCFQLSRINFISGVSLRINLI